VVVVASAGNATDTYFVSGSPAVAGRALSVAGSHDDGKGAMLRALAPPALAGDFAAGAAFFGANLTVGSVSGDVALANDGTGTPTDGCEAFAGFPQGAVALVDRGTCSFKTQALNAQVAGAIGVIVSWNTPYPPPLGDDPTIVTPITIPTVSVTLATGNALKAALASETVTVTLLAAGDSLYNLSSRGPRAGVPVRLKPDVAAPGYAITSARNGRTAGGYSPDSASYMLSGTSMAAPHVSGLMALLRQLHPGWTVEELKALAMTNSSHDVTQYSGGLGLRFGMGRVGAGRVDAAAAMDDVVALGLDERGLVSVVSTARSRAPSSARGG
jgi:subtilisin family serine protease